MMSHNKKINVLEAFALSLATMAPTGSMAGNTGPGAKFAGVNLPIAFIVAAVAMLLVAVGFCEMSKYIAADGSVYAYNRVSLGERWGFVSGWLMMLSYTVMGVAMCALSGTYGSLILKNMGLKVSPLLFGLFLVFLMWFILSHGIKITSNFSLVSESLALLILLVLSVTILTKGGGQGGINVQPFVPQVSMSGLGQGVIYTVLCFVGFEVCCSVATRTENPKKSIPLSLLLTILGGMVVFAFVSYAVVVGFGTKDVSALASSSAPLNVLAKRFIGAGMATLVDFAIFLSTFGAAVCVTNGAAYMWYAFGKKGYLPHQLGQFNFHHNAPSFATHTVCGLDVVLYLLLTLTQGNAKTYLYFITTGAICMILIYMLNCVGSFTFFRHHERKHHSFWKHDLAPWVGFLVLASPLVANFYPMPAFPLNVLPYLVLLWGVGGYFLSRYHEKKADLNDN